MSERLDWDGYFLGVASAVSARSDCRRRKVGAVLTHDNRILGTGYNGTRLSGQRSCADGACPRGLKTVEELPGYDQGNQDYTNCIAVHAEMNALKQFKKWVLMLSHLQGRLESFPSINWAGYLNPAPIIYVTDQPCDGCTKDLIKAGIVEFRWPNGRWSQIDHR